MLPTPSKFHYVFNMRELSRIFKGILNVRKDVINQASSVGQSYTKPEVFVVGLWRHECERVFVDKMVNNKDKQTIMNMIQEISIDKFSNLESEINDKFNSDKLFLFCDFLREDIKNEDGIVEVPGERIYEAINNMEKLRKRCYDLLAEYNLKYPS
jgi:dynein heavy chain, axonemal